MDALARLDRKFTALFGPGLDVLADERNLDKTRAYAASFAQSYAKLGAEYAASGLSAASATANGKAYELLVAYAESRVRHNPPLPVDTQAQQLMTEVLLAAQEGLRAQSDTLTHRVAEARREGYVGDGVGDRLARLSLRQGSPASPGGRPSFAPATPTSPGLAPPRVAATPSSSSSRGGGLAARAAATPPRAPPNTPAFVATPARGPRGSPRPGSAATASARALGSGGGRLAVASPVASGPSLEDLGLSRPTPPRAGAGAKASPRRVSLEGPQAAAAAAAAEAASAQLRSLVQQAAQLRRDADGLAALLPPRLRAKTAATAAAGADPAADAAWASGYVLWERALPKTGSAPARVPRAVPERALCTLRLSAAGELAEVALRLRLFVEVVPIAVATLRASLAAGSRAAVERAEAHLLQLALPAPAAAAADGAALRAEAAKLPHCRGELVSLRPAARGRPAALALTLAPSAEPPFGADGVVIGRLLDGHDLLTQLCANRAAASGPPIEVKLDD